MRQLDLQVPSTLRLIGIEVEEPYVVSTKMCDKLEMEVTRIADEIHTAVSGQSAASSRYSPDRNFGVSPGWILMERAFVFANVVAGSEIEVLKELRNIPDVKEAYFVYGVYDIVVIVETDSMARLREISAQIRSLSNIRSTSTTVAMQG